MLRIYGNLSLLEMAPVLLAADQIYPGKTLLEHGSVMALWGKASDLASLTSAGQADLATNSETQALRGSFAQPGPALHLHRRRVPLSHRGSPLGGHHSARRPARQTGRDAARVVGRVFPGRDAAHRGPHGGGRHARAFHGQDGGADQPAAGAASQRQDRCRGAVGAAGAEGQGGHRRRRHRVLRSGGLHREIQSLHHGKPIWTILRCGRGSSLSCAR